MSSQDENIIEAAKELLNVLETPINGQPSVTVRNRANALRLVQASFEEVYLALTEDEEDPTYGD